jgi:hypothetical protein
MILITQFWNFENPKRKEEIYECLLNNAKNRYINKIYVFSENNSYMKFHHNKIVPLKADHRLTYFEMFKTVNQSFRNQICIVANADVYFDESIVKANHIDYKNKIVALSSYDSVTKQLEDFSIDSWILKSTTIPYSEYRIGESHDDLRLISTLSENDIEIINPCKEIFSYHVDSNKKLKYIPNESLDYVEPSTLKEKPVKREKIVEVKEEPKVEVRSNPKPKPFVKKEPINSVVPVNNVKVAVHLHLYYQDLWDEFSSILKNLKSYDYDIYVTLTKGSATIGQTKWIKEKIQKDFKNAKVFEVDNKGLDVGAFLTILEYISSQNKHYDYLLKLHTKKSVKTAGIEFGANWRKQLYKPLIGDENTVNSILSKMQSNDKIGMVGNTTWVSDFEGLNKGKIEELKSMLGIKTNNKRFIGGTMFWVKYPIIKTYFNTYAIKKISYMLESGYFTDYETGTYTHALERIFGYMVSDSNKTIEGVK